MQALSCRWTPPRTQHITVPWPQLYGRHARLWRLPRSPSHARVVRSLTSTTTQDRYGEVHSPRIRGADGSTSHDAKSSFSRGSMRSVHVPSKLRQAIQRGFRQQDPFKLLQAIQNISEREDVLASIPVTCVSEIFRTLRAERFIIPARAIHHNLSQGFTYHLRIQSIEDIFRRYFQVIETLTTVRSRMRLPLTLTDYTVLLDFTRATGNEKIADRLWAQLRQEGHQPDAACFNHYLETIGWSGLFLPGTRQTVSTYNYWLHHVKERRKRLGSLDPRQAAIRVYEEMVRDGVRADAKTFQLLIISMARALDVEGVNWILKSVWNIDVPGLFEKDEASLEPVKQYPPDSPLCPDAKLLMTIAHAFCVCDVAPVAIRLVDYVSRQYNLTIPLEVWAELLERTFVLSAPPGSLWRTDRPMSTRLPTRSVTALWETMLSEPYDVQPRMDMYHHSIKAFERRQIPLAVLKLLREGQQLHQRSVRTFEQAQRKLRLLEGLEARGVEFNIPHYP